MKAQLSRQSYRKINLRLISLRENDHRTKDEEVELKDLRATVERHLKAVAPLNTHRAARALKEIRKIPIQ
jgi:hypothetical protein